MFSFSCALPVTPVLILHGVASSDWKIDRSQYFVSVCSWVQPTNKLTGIEWNSIPSTRPSTIWTTTLYFCWEDRWTTPRPFPPLYLSFPEPNHLVILLWVTLSCLYINITWDLAACGQFPLFLLFNLDKIEVTVLGPKHCKKILYKHFSKNSFLMLHRLKKKAYALSKKCRKAFVSSRLDNCNSLSSGYANKLFKNLQFIRNAGAQGLCMTDPEILHVHFRI